ncbi:MAG: L-rhamnose isomerase [Porphyromonadaceae bacterium CG2_30_38_12]|nr:MAG: L-rhamnose isomerase [Porphyromonadaceae bacterium CG2_30_38_12]
MKKEQIQQSFEIAKARYAEVGVDVHRAMNELDKLPISLHCWQADDVTGFENPDGILTGGIQTTGNYPGKARNIAELRADIDKAMALIPGNHRVNIHAFYGDFGGHFVDRDQIEPKHFQSWIDWAKEKNYKLDFNCTCFSHDKSADGLTLSHPDPEIRKFWIEHVIRSRKIAEEMGRQLGSKCMHNIWIPDGSKDITVNRLQYRKNLKESLDTIFEYKTDDNLMRDCIESKLFGIGAESYTVGSHEFYLGYGVRNNVLVTLDAGHFHPTELISDKISSLLLYLPEVMLHVTRGIRWDSDHVVILNEELLAIAQEIVRADAVDKVHVGLDYFDASINRIGAYVVGVRATQKALMQALLEPLTMLRAMEAKGQKFERLALLEEAKSLPWNAVFDYYCMQKGVLVGQDYIADIQKYETDVTSKR